jgi:dihydrofolate reductase
VPVPRSVYFCAATLDGYIAEADDSIEWLTGYQGSYESPGAEPMKGSYDRFYERIGALAMGSTTYEWVLEHVDSWPYAGKPTWVFSSRSLSEPDAEAADVRFVDGAVEPVHEAMAAAAGDRDLWLVGGGNLASQFADAGLLDEILVTVVPVVLGAGKPLFDRRLPGGPLKLIGSRSFDTGMVELRYEVQSPSSD